MSLKCRITVTRRAQPGELTRSGRRTRRIHRAEYHACEPAHPVKSMLFILIYKESNFTNYFLSVRGRVIIATIATYPA